MKRRGWVLSLLGGFGFLFGQQRVGPTNYPVCPFGHRNNFAQFGDISFQTIDSDGNVTEVDNMNFCRTCGCMFVTKS